MGTGEWTTGSWDNPECGQAATSPGGEMASGKLSPGDATKRESANGHSVKPGLTSEKASDTRRVSDDELRMLAPSHELQHVSYAFGQAYQLCRRVFTAISQSMGLTSQQHSALYALLLSERPLGPTDLSRLLPMEPQSVTALLDRLEEMRLVVRRRSSKDRRAVKVRLTPAGHDLLRASVPRIRDAHQLTLGTLSHEELRHLAAISDKLSRAAMNLLGANPEAFGEAMERSTERLARIEGSGNLRDGNRNARRVLASKAKTGRGEEHLS